MSGTWICEYPGKLSQRRGSKRPPENWTPEGNFAMFFPVKDEKERTMWFCRDANDADFQGVGSKINHPSRAEGEKPNVKPVPIMSYTPPRVFIKALCDILPGEELLYNYGETDKEAIKDNPFLAWIIVCDVPLCNENCTFLILQVSLIVPSATCCLKSLEIRIQGQTFAPPMHVFPFPCTDLAWDGKC